MEAQAIIQACSKFACDLYKFEGEENVDKNVFMSPISISIALAMTCMGAKNNTAQEMRDVLHLNGVEEENLHCGFGELVGKLYSQDSGYVLKIANRLFGEKSYNFLQEFLEATKVHYKAGLLPVDYISAFEQTRQHINGWVEEITEQKIQELLPQGAVDSLTRLVLVNAIYFKGDWMTKFNDKVTKDGYFNVDTNKKVETRLMFQKSKLLYGRNADLKCAALELPYEGGTLSMFIILPEATDGLRQLEDQLNESHLMDTQNVFKMGKADVEVTLPRFKLEQSMSLMDTLKSLGMKDLFDESKCDLSGVDGSRNLYVSHVIHKAYVDVNEEGTEAAAATAVLMQIRCMPRPPLAFRADHPFLFFIKHIQSGSVLFMGRLVNPTL